MDHRLNGFGYVPGGFEHMEQPMHTARAGQGQVELTREPMVFPRVVLGERGLEQSIDLDEMGAVVLGGEIDRHRKGGSLQNFSDDVHFTKLGCGQLSHRVTEVRPMIDQSLTDEGLEGFAHRDSAHTEKFRYLVERYRRIRWRIAGENNAA